MASVDKVKVGSTTYNISPSKDGTLTGFTSNDAASPSAWTAVNTITTSDSNSSIFSKITTMVKNVRWLYNKLGQTDFSSTGQSTVTGALKSLQTSVNGKAAASHSHTTADLPVSSTQTNSTSYIPTSALVYSMQQQITSLNDAITNLLLDDPNKRTKPSNLGTWTSVSDVDTFLSRFNHANNYRNGNIELNIGDSITIRDGTYNSIWQIAGFNVEHNRTAIDGTVYDNGYGIALIPKTRITTAPWNPSNTIYGGYNNCHINQTVLPQAVINLKNVVGSHIIKRNVLLSDGQDANNSFKSNSYRWTTAHATLMSVCQITGEPGTHCTIYDDGEANYKLPYFNYNRYWTGYQWHTRGVYTPNGPTFVIWNIYTKDIIGGTSVDSNIDIRPFIYLR